MLFNSYEFIFAFLPITFFIYFLLNKNRLIEAGKGWLVFSSLVFYSWWNIVYLPLILISMLFNYVVGNILSMRQSIVHIKITRKNILICGIMFNLLLLGYFKYMDFFISSINYVFVSDIKLVNVALPLAISFFTFQQITYLVDSYRFETQEYDFLNYAVFVSFFPQLVAGPIVHHKEMMPQFANIRTKIIDYKNISSGLYIFSIGLFKKVVIADMFAIWAINGFDISKTLNFIEAWVTSLSYTLQLYFDFSGYSDMAIGLALLFNIKLPINFNSPYKAKNVQDFWDRWHITLSRFFRDYVYIQLGGNRKGNFRKFSNLMITFVLCGFWHGAGWTFIFWGFLHGIALTIFMLWDIYGFRLSRWISWLVTFNFVNIAWIFFRANEWKDAIKVLKGMVGLNGITLPGFLDKALSSLKAYGVNFGSFVSDINGSVWMFVWIILGILAVVTLKNINYYISKRTTFKQILIGSIAFSCSIVITLVSSTKIFLYFNF